MMEPIPDSARLTDDEVVRIMEDSGMWAIARAAGDKAYQAGLDAGENSAEVMLEMLGKHNKKLRADNARLQEELDAANTEGTLLTQKLLMRTEERDTAQAELEADKDRC